MTDLPLSELAWKSILERVPPQDATNTIAKLSPSFGHEAMKLQTMNSAARQLSEACSHDVAGWLCTSSRSSMP